MKKISILFLAILIGLSGCEDYLDRGNLDKLDDNTFWTNEGNLRIYVQGNYTNYFVGYGTGYAGGPYFTFGPWADEYASSTLWTQNTATSGNGWSFGNVRRHNIMIGHIDEMPITDEAKAHWMGIGRFFRALEYSDLVRAFGDVPWYDREIFPTEPEEMYKDRQPMAYIATRIKEDFEYAAGTYEGDQLKPTVRVTDGVQQVNRDVVLAYMTRCLLYMGTYLKYHNGDQSVATELLQKAKWAAEELIKGGKYQVADDYRGIFTSADLTANKEVIFFRQYEVAKSTHSLVSYNNAEGQTGTTLKALETYLAADGFPIKQSPAYNYAKDNGMRFYKKQYAGRDPRLAATLVDTTKLNGTGVSGYSSTGIACWKFLPYTANGTDQIYQGSNNTTDAPVIRYGEVLMNYAEAAAELGQFDQAAADRSINKLRNRSILKNNTGAALPKLPAMTVSGDQVTVGGVPINDPDRDPSVSPLLWEIRRERAVELMYEGFRKNDLKRWNKLDYLRTVQDGDVPTKLSLGAWVDLSKYTATQKTNILKNVKFYNPDPTKKDLGFVNVLYDVNMRRDWKPGDAYYEKQYLNAVPLDQITLYNSLGYRLTQNPGWE